MSSTAITNGRGLVDGQFVDVDVVVEGGLIDRVGPGEGRSSTGPVVDAMGLFVAPGFIDLQVNGGYGIDLAHEPERLPELAAELPRHGVTAWLPTLVSAPPSMLTRFLNAVGSAVAELGAGTTGAQPLGAHLEGPVLAPAKAGAHVVEFLVGPAEFERTLRAHPDVDVVRLVTLAPELPSALDLVRHLVEEGVIVSVGHTEATAEDVHAAAEAGARYATHLFNVMSGFHHREPGAGVAALVDERVTAGLIVDGHHLHDDTVRLAWRMLGPERTSLVSDATAALGMAGPTTSLGTAGLVVDTAVRTESGKLAGTNLALDAAVRNLVAITGASLADAVATVTSVPADLLGDATRGRIEPGRRADLVLLDADGFPHATLVAGQ